MTPLVKTQDARPAKLPFLESICWQTDNVYRFTSEQMLSRYERGWAYRQLFNNLAACRREASSSRIERLSRAT
jgi:hypothetical protein